MDYRLKKEKDYKLVFGKGKRLFSNSLTLLYLPSESIKAGYAVSKKHGGSVKRNRIKRLLRETFRKFLPKIEGSFYFVFIPKIKEEYELNNFVKDTEYLLKKGGLLKK